MIFQKKLYKFAFFLQAENLTIPPKYAILKKIYPDIAAFLKGEKMRIKIILTFLLIPILLFTSACSPASSGNYEKEQAAEIRNSNHVYLTVWSWQIVSEEDALDYAKKAKECGFTALDFGVLWSAFEPVKGHFNWAYLDKVVEIFSDAGLNISLQPLLWTKDLSWADELALQKTESGGVYTVEDRGSFLSFSDPKTRKTVENTLQNFALHAAETYGSVLTRWGVRLSCFGEFDFSVNADLDYSEGSLRGFYDQLKDTYGSWQNLANARKINVSNRSELEAMNPKDVTDACAVDWRRFRQKQLFDFLEIMVDIYRSADASVPILFSLGTYGNGMNTAFSGVVDLWQAVEQHDFDIVGLSLSDGADADMMLALLTSLTDKKIAVELDGAWALEEGRNVAAQGEICGKHQVFSLSTANFTKEQLDAHKETLKTYPQLLAKQQPLAEQDPTRGILIFSNALGEQEPPKSYDALYGDLWKTLSENGTRRVRFLTEEQIAAGKVSLEGITTLYPGNIKGFVSVSKSFAQTLSKSNAVIIGEISFDFLDGSSPDEDLKTALAERVKAE